MQQVNQGGPGGISLGRAVCYVLGVLGVLPIVSLPGALVYCGWLGFVMFVVLVVVEVYTAVLLARSWLILELFWPREAHLHHRHPYPGLAEKAGGVVLRKIVSGLLNIAIFGAAIPFMLLASETMQQLVVSTTGWDLSFCYWLLVLTVALTPLLWFGTPKDLGVVTWVGGVSVVVVTGLTLASLFLDPPSSYKPPPEVPTWTSAAYCFGVIAFQFDIHPVILTVQMDMKQRHQLPLALIISFTVSGLLFLVVTGASFALYGSAVKANILNSFDHGPLLYVNMAIVCVQMLLCLVLGINALFQNLENCLNIPDASVFSLSGHCTEFGWRRVLVRTGVMALLLFMCESIPHFGVAIELVGGLLVTPFIFIFPPAFHISIKHKACGRIDVRDLVLAANIIVMGIVGCIAATSQSLIQVAQLSNFAPPCYINATAVSIAAREYQVNHYR
ncbi:hypothetical protein Pcinc_022960 [Petrolisthes cinctipes]|uniref:Amino acid transporter transmembrane domain-containing protein n=1 Tax=Petrolisthes cinctipes TaxID=88211 RepID=A0AAE1FGS0_PETCI|nr:hypothetical protein Pcinc_022960 [Petrolisthes cinctipes]